VPLFRTGTPARGSRRVGASPPGSQLCRCPDDSRLQLRAQKYTRELEVTIKPWDGCKITKVDLQRVRRRFIEQQARLVGVSKLVYKAQPEAILIGKARSLLYRKVA
jgi:hypothetical protein